MGVHLQLPVRGLSRIMAAPWHLPLEQDHSSSGGNVGSAAPCTPMEPNEFLQEHPPLMGGGGPPLRGSDLPGISAEGWVLLQMGNKG